MAEKIRAAVLGIGHSHASGKVGVLQASEDFELVGVCEPDEAVRKSRGNDAAYKEVTWLGLDAVLGDESIQLIVIETHVWENLRYAAMAVEAGKHVHLDKPPGNDLNTLAKLFERAARKHLHIQMGYMWRYNAGFDFAINAAKKGWLGQVYLVRGTVNSIISPVHRVQLARYQGGMMFELGCHILDRMIALLGEPTKVTPYLRHDNPDQDELADNTLAVFEFGKAMAVLSSSARQAGAFGFRSFEVIGTAGTVQVQPLEPPKVRLILDKPQAGFKAGSQEVMVRDRGRYEGDFEEFARVLRDGATPSFTPKHDLIMHRALLAACGQLG
jgi:predicted dehydrogenase